MSDCYTLEETLEELVKLFPELHGVTRLQVAKLQVAELQVAKLRVAATRFNTPIFTRMPACAVAVFNSRSVHGEVIFEKIAAGIRIKATFSKLPVGDHGFHIHRAGDLRGEGCKLACDHFHVGPAQDHGGPPGSKGERHTGDLGNISLEGDSSTTFTYTLKGLDAEDLWGRSMIVHADHDDLGLGNAEDSKKTGHSGKRIACAVIGRVAPC